MTIVKPIPPAKYKPGKVDTHIADFKSAFERLRGYRREGNFEQTRLVSEQIDGKFNVITAHQDLNIFHLENMLEFLRTEKSDFAGRYTTYTENAILSLQKNTTKKTTQPEHIEVVSHPVTSTMLVFGSGKPC